MKLESLENYKLDSYRFKVFASIIVVTSLASNVLLFYWSRQDIAAAYEQIWVVDRHSRPYQAELHEAYTYEGRIYEYEEAVREFYENALSADDTDYNKKLERALHLSAAFINGQNVEDYWREENMVTNVLENMWRYSATCDSVLFDLESRPMKGYAFGRQVIQMKRRKVVRNMHLSFTLYDVNQRTRNNPFAVKLDGLDIFNNKVIERK